MIIVCLLCYQQYFWTLRLKLGIVSGKLPQKGTFWSLNQRPRISEQNHKISVIDTYHDARRPNRKVDVRPHFVDSPFRFFTNTTRTWRTLIAPRMALQMPQIRKRWSRLVFMRKSCGRRLLTAGLIVDPEKTP
jgi:hypothetical protein